MTATVVTSDVARRVGATVIALTASELAGKVATFVTFMVLARALGVAGFGVLSFGLSLGLLLAVLSSLGLDARLIQLGSARPELLDGCYGALLCIRAGLCALVLAATTALLLVLMPAVEAIVVALMVASGLADTFCDAARSACGARQQQYLSAMVTVVQRVAVLVLSVGAIIASSGPVGVAVGYLAGTGVGVAGMLFAAARVGAHARFGGNREERRLLLSAVPIMGVGAIVSTGMFRIDSTLIAIIMGTTAVGLYNANYRIFETALFFSWTLARAYVPVIAAGGSAEHVRVWTQRSLIMVCAAYLPYGVLLAVRGEDLVAMLFGVEYTSHGVMLGLAAAPVLFGIAYLGSSVLYARRPDPAALVASLAALVINIALNLWLIPVWGVTAAAIASDAAFLVEAIVVMRAVTSIAGPVVPVRPLLAVVAASACCGLVAAAIGPVLLAVVAAGVVYLLAAAALLHLATPELTGQLRALLS